MKTSLSFRSFYTTTAPTPAPTTATPTSEPTTLSPTTATPTAAPSQALVLNCLPEQVAVVPFGASCVSVNLAVPSATRGGVAVSVALRYSEATPGCFGAGDRLITVTGTNQGQSASCSFNLHIGGEPCAAAAAGRMATWRRRPAAWLVLAHPRCGCAERCSNSRGDDDDDYCATSPLHGNCTNSYCNLVRAPTLAPFTRYA
jgi:hypothetical protein